MCTACWRNRQHLCTRRSLKMEQLSPHQRTHQRPQPLQRPQRQRHPGPGLKPCTARSAHAGSILAGGHATTKHRLDGCIAPTTRARILGVCIQRARQTACASSTFHRACGRVPTAPRCHQQPQNRPLHVAAKRERLETTDLKTAGAARLFAWASKASLSTTALRLRKRFRQ